MTAPRTSGECALLGGAPECLCTRDTANLTEEQVVTRALTKMRFEQRADRAGKAAARRGLDAMLDQARERGPSTLVSELLRMGIMIRLLGEDEADTDEVEALLQEFVELAELDADPRRLGEAATLRAHRTAVFGHGENALADAACAFAILTDIAAPTGEDPERWSRYLSRSLNGLVIVLLKLGSHELADEVSQRAVAVAESSGSVMDRLVHQLNRVRLQLSWALRLERGGRDTAAATRFGAAAQTAHAAAGLWTTAMRTGRPATEECSVIGAAYALARPGPQHLDMLAGLHPVAHFPEDRVVLAIATARCLLTAGRPDDAVAALVPLQAQLRPRTPGTGATAGTVLTLALHREVARVDHIAHGGAPSGPLQLYAAALESEMWALREARHTALRSHAEHHRLAREHGAVAAQALQDPLTGLPNRRALDMRLAEVVADTAGQPCAVALIDLDGFKNVNDERSHAAGDEVLRVIAGCLRSTLRARDLVARYGGDEFVVVMPATPLPVARAALRRAADAVAALPVEVAAGVTASIGVVRAPPDGEPAAALAAADAAMYRAKHAGGNTVVSGAAVPVAGR